ncbi:hypothetical protein BDV95DRAFT_180591 [Massariosphaeria phaeospora]|uniref:F-box domain-containing protein n=1 Tax=Massariosphaeria phaeospora TaxID=100035 RepID=A0A7C8M1W0_9PLEO|nr:hypothetical protein BDV95DRAFT_180591 [Massariosphaeria phaeospora]
MATPSPRLPFIDLPAELRLEIYSCIIPPNPSPRALYSHRGLFLSCRQIHDELQRECVKELDKPLEEIKRAWPIATFQEYRERYAPKSRIELRMPPPPTKLCQARRMVFKIPVVIPIDKSFDNWSYDREILNKCREVELKTFLDFLAQRLARSFTIRLYGVDPILGRPILADINDVFDEQRRSPNVTVRYWAEWLSRRPCDLSVGLCQPRRAD